MKVRCCKPLPFARRLRRKRDIHGRLAESAGATTNVNDISLIYFNIWQEVERFAVFCREDSGAALRLYSHQINLQGMFPHGVRCLTAEG